MQAPISRVRCVQENRVMRFEEAFQGWRAGRLTQAEAAMLLGQCERSFRRHVERYKADGLEGLLDKRLSQVSKRRASVAEVDRVVQTYKSGFAGLERGALSQQVPKRVRGHAQLYLGQERAAECGAGPNSQAPGQAPHQTRTRAAARDDGAPGRQHPPLGARRSVGVRLSPVGAAISSQADPALRNRIICGRRSCRASGGNDLMSMTCIADV